MNNRVVNNSRNFMRFGEVVGSIFICFLLNFFRFFSRYSRSYIRWIRKGTPHVATCMPTKYRRYARASCTQKRNGSFGVVNAPRSGKNPGLVYRGRQRRDSCVAAGSACHKPMGSPSNADDADGR